MPNERAEEVYCPTDSVDASIKVGASTAAPIMIVKGGVEHSKLLPWLMLTAILSGFALSTSLLTFVYLHDQMLRDQRSFEYMRIQVLSQNAILLREGFVRPGDEWIGPEGNLQFNPELLHRKK